MDVSNKKGCSRIKLAGRQQEQAGTEGRAEGYIPKRQVQEQKLEQMETGVRSQDRRPELKPSAWWGNLSYGKTISQAFKPVSTFLGNRLWPGHLTVVRIESAEEPKN